MWGVSTGNYTNLRPEPVSFIGGIMAPNRRHLNYTGVYSVDISIESAGFDAAKVKKYKS
jgi:hypothetical protein